MYKIFTKHKNNGFTLIELLIVIAIIGLLSTLAVVALSNARAKARDAKRISDIKQIQKALELYISEYGTLPMPMQYGEQNSSPGWWDTWWDLSSGDGDNDGIYFLDFLVDSGIMRNVPKDPLNTPEYNGYPNANGFRYIYFVAPKGYAYQGGSCVVDSGSVYLLGISDLETDSRPPQKFSGSGCECLWKNLPNMFQSAFDYVICGTF
jgi:general secretion pathway protein G